MSSEIYLSGELPTTIFSSLLMKEKLLIEANNSNVTLVGNCAEHGYSQYRLPCGHVAKKSNSAVRNNEVRCKQCVYIKLAEEAKEHNIELLLEDKAPKGSGVYRFPCGHKEIKQSHTVRSKTAICRTCYTSNQESLVAEAEKYLNIAVIKPLGNGLRECSFNSCNHRFKMDISKIISKVAPASCIPCRHIAIHAIASSSGIEYIESQKNCKSGYKLFRLSCGCEKEIAICALKQNHFACRVHDQTSYNRDSYLYVLDITTSDRRFIKVGIASDPDTRNIQLKIYNIESCVVVQKTCFVDRYESTKFEKSLHKHFKQINLPHDSMKSVMRQGFTECYPTTELSDILDYISSQSKATCLSLLH